MYAPKINMNERTHIYIYSVKAKSQAGNIRVGNYVGSTYLFLRILV